ncbi:phosphoenolpyruvate carboxykinase (GTP), partial [Elusimicrobiota bacterium]
PDKVFINTGSEADLQFIRELVIKTGEEKKLAMKGHTIHFDLAGEQGRITDRTFYIANEGEAVSSLGKKKLRAEALEDIRGKMTGIMKGKTMVVGFYIRGPVGAPVSNPALEISSSGYVCHSAEILYRNRFADFDKEVEKLGHIYVNVHSEGPNRPEDLPNARVYMDRSHWTTFSIFCTYAGNTLLMKKGNHRFSVDKAVYTNRANELSEHMFITGMKGPGGRVTWFAGAAPSGCGKTTTAMAGDLFVGDDLAQMWIEKDRTVRAINPECGIFGIVQDVNREGDPYLMDLLRKEGAEVIWSNVLIDDKGVPHWKNNGEETPKKGFNFQGEWVEGKKDAKGKLIPHSHPNSRCTVTASKLPNYSPENENPEGVVTRVVTYSGRDSDTMPPVWVGKNSDHGVLIGACIVSAATATEVGATGVKRAPWANAPFIPGALGDYMDAQFRFFASDKIADDKRPIMAGLNYFLTHEARGGEGKKLLGEKRDVKVWLSWLERRTYGEVEAIETPIGYLPKYEDLQKLFKEKIDKEYPRELYDKQFSLYIENIVKRLDLQLDAYGKEQNLPDKLFEVLKEQKKGLLALKEKHGAIVKPAELSKASCAA